MRENFTAYEHPGKFERAGEPMVEYLYNLVLEGGEDEASGTAPTYGVWFARLGRWIITENQAGSVMGERFDTHAEAKNQFRNYQLDYEVWYDDCIEREGAENES